MGVSGERERSEARKLFDALEGNWAIARNISPSGRFAGRANFEKMDNDTYHYREKGQLHVPNAMPIEGTRDYIYRLEGDELNIYFPEQPLRLFQQITLSRQQDTGYLHANAYHRCSADDYRSSYCFKSEKDFTIVHRVTGPRKDYTLTTDYRRID